jgi:hypothetical protein
VEIERDRSKRAGVVETGMGGSGRERLMGVEEHMHADLDGRAVSARSHPITAADIAIAGGSGGAAAASKQAKKTGFRVLNEKGVRRKGRAGQEANPLLRGEGGWGKKRGAVISAQTFPTHTQFRSTPNL